MNAHQQLAHPKLSGDRSFRGRVVSPRNTWREPTVAREITRTTTAESDYQFGQSDGPECQPETAGLGDGLGRRQRNT